MIYGLLWSAFVACLLAMRRISRRRQAKYGAIAGVMLSVLGWLFHLAGFEPGSTLPSFHWAALGGFALLTIATLLTLVRVSVQSDQDLQEWVAPAAFHMELAVITAVMFAAVPFGVSFSVALGVCVLIWLASFFGPLLWRRKHSRRA